MTRHEAIILTEKLNEAAANRYGDNKYVALMALYEAFTRDILAGDIKKLSYTETIINDFAEKWNREAQDIATGPVPPHL